ncbi:hypothetical protein K8352_00375 [Flavobacteriaceae bacterium F89]|uniref:Uncharacterized protein n=1 Tax=Cerina litoralis TaxID=2874477 RepID=A0AAE3JLZ3_9FLAO|nr:hypothetical protein [Cerina litoralis]MCG2459195.1 hypothetical protein [Cerina litoralis]
MKILKFLILLIVLGSLVSIIYGFTILEREPDTANKCIGGGTVGLFLIAMPLFLFAASKGKNIKDYMLNEENIRKMQEKNRRKNKNQ